MNTLKIVFLMTFLTVLLVAVGQATFGSRGAVTALVIAAVMNLSRAPLLDPPADRGAHRAPRGDGAGGLRPA